MAIFSFYQPNEGWKQCFWDYMVFEIQTFKKIFKRVLIIEKGMMFCTELFLWLQGTSNRDIYNFWKRVLIIERVLIIKTREYILSLWSELVHTILCVLQIHYCIIKEDLKHWPLTQSNLSYFQISFLTEFIRIVKMDGCNCTLCTRPYVAPK